MSAIMRSPLFAALLAVGWCLAGQGCASSEPKTLQARVTTNAEAVRGCESVGFVSDNDWHELSKKATRLGGNVALVMTQELRRTRAWGGPDYLYSAEVYRCP